MSPLRAAIILIGHSPEEWQPELAGVLGGVIVMPGNVTARELESLKNRKLPFLIVGETDLAGPRIRVVEKESSSFTSRTIPSIDSDFFTAGRLAAEALNREALTGEPASDVILERIYHRDPLVDFQPGAEVSAMLVTK
jgi:hypothetical protein